MKKQILIAAMSLGVLSAAALPKAIYVKKGDDISKFNFGVADNLVFSNQGRTLNVKGYNETIDLDAIDYISFTAPVTPGLTPSQQKQRLVDIGTEAYNIIYLHDQSDILNMVHAFADDFNYEGGYWHAPVNYWLDPDYYDVHHEFRSLMQAMARMVKGDPAAVRSFKAKVVNLYKIEDYYGIYTADGAQRKWVKTPADYIELRFDGPDGVKYSARLDAGTEYSEWNTRDFNGRFPRHIDLKVTAGGRQLASATIDTELVQDTSISMTLDFEANRYVVHNVLKVTNTLMTDNVDVTVKGTRYVVADTRISGRNMVKYDVMFDAIKAASGYYDEETDDYVDEDATDLMACFTRAEATADVMGKLQVKGRVYNPSLIYERLSKESDDYTYFELDGVNYYSYGKLLSRNGDEIHVAATEEAIYDSYAACLNDYTDAAFYYDGNTRLQGYLGWDVCDDIDLSYMEWGNDSYGYVILDNGMMVYATRDGQDTGWYYQGYRDDGQGHYDYVKTYVDESQVIHPTAVHTHWAETKPLLYFPDQTSFYFEDFFDEISFKSLIDDYNEIIDTYLSITGQDRDSDDD